jgi:hypothetical protein
MASWYLEELLQAITFRNGDGTTVMGPRNRDRERQNPDLVRPPSTDHARRKRGVSRHRLLTKQFCGMASWYLEELLQAMILRP